jgi:RNA polymerase sigma factor (sigma-70 family)
MIRTIWRIVRDPQDAEDAMQEALLTIWMRWHRVCKHPRPEALVLKICVDAAYDLTRRRLRQRRRLELADVAGEPSATSCSPPGETIRAEQHAEILKAIHRLSRRQAVAALMRLVEGQSYGQIAAALGCTEATVRKHVARARGRLRVALAHLAPDNRKGVDHESG